MIIFEIMWNFNIKNTSIKKLLLKEMEKLLISCVPVYLSESPEAQDK